MNKQLKDAFHYEIDLAKKFIRERDYIKSFHHLERAHILGQLYILPHTYTHLLMLKVGILKKDLKEVLGQLFRIPLGVIGSFVGIVPSGNSGGSNVNAFEKMEISEDLKKYL